MDTHFILTRHHLVQVFKFAMLSLFLMMSPCLNADEETSLKKRDVLKADAGSPKHLAVAVLDKRSFVLSGEKPPSYFGKLKYAFGEPDDAEIASGAAVATVYSNFLAELLSNNQQNFKAVDLPLKSSPDKIYRKMFDKNINRVVILTLNEWESWTKKDTELVFEVVVSVYDRAHGLVAREKFEGDTTIVGSALSGPKTNVKNALETAIPQIMRLIFKDTAINNALVARNVKPMIKKSIRPESESKKPVPVKKTEKASQQPALIKEKPRKPSRCSVQDILNLKNLGIADKAILSRCKTAYE